MAGTAHPRAAYSWQRKETSHTHIKQPGGEQDKLGEKHEEGSCQDNAIQTPASPK